MDRGVWWATVHGVARVGHDLVTKPTPTLSSFIAVCKVSSDNHCAFLHFSFLGMVLITASCTMSGTFIHRSSGTLVYQIESLESICPFHYIVVMDLI